MGWFCRWFPLSPVWQMKMADRVMLRRIYAPDGYKYQKVPLDTPHA